MEYIGLLGCGSIGSSLANSIVTKSINGASLLVIFDQDIEKARICLKSANNCKWVEWTDMIAKGEK